MSRPSEHYLNVCWKFQASVVTNQWLTGGWVVTKDVWNVLCLRASPLVPTFMKFFTGGARAGGTVTFDFSFCLRKWVNALHISQRKCCSIISIVQGPRNLDVVEIFLTLVADHDASFLGTRALGAVVPPSVNVTVKINTKTVVLFLLFSRSNTSNTGIFFAGDQRWVSRRGCKTDEWKSPDTQSAPGDES